MLEGNQHDWRELCAAAVHEPDSEKLADLVNQIIKALDERAGKLKIGVAREVQDVLSAVRRK
jgi:hypothetical protein